MKIIHLSYSDDGGGAFIATKRLHLSLLNKNIDSEMWVEKQTGENSQSKIVKLGGNLHSLKSILRRFASKLIVKLFVKDKYGIFSLNIFPAQLVQEINSSDADLIHLHWIHSEMLSISEIGLIEKPVVWTLHDIWAFGGGEHYPTDDGWLDGYDSSDESALISIRRFLWKYKKQAWKRPINIIAPSNWMKNLVSQSPLFFSADIGVIHNTIDTDLWAPIKKEDARNYLNIDERPTLIFGAIGGKNDPRKGYDLLEKILNEIKIYYPKIKLNILVFGCDSSENKTIGGFHYKFIKHTMDINEMIVIYSAADVMLIPSRQDNLPNTALEALTCGLPCISFDVGGLRDLIFDRRMGYTVEPYDVVAFRAKLVDMLSSTKFDRNVIRALALKRFGQDTVASQHIKLYKKMLSGR